MSHKVHPKIFRARDINNWASQWFNRRKYRDYLEQDYNIRNFIKERLKQAGIDEVVIKRSGNSIHIIIRTGRPGIIIGRGGTGIQDLKTDLIRKIFKGGARGIDIKIDVEEIPKSETRATIIGQWVAEQLERRIPFRRAMKQAIEKVMQNPEVKGVKIWVSGRLNGAEMARSEWLKKGRLPLQTLRANIDYAQINAYTIYGIIGVKVWICKDEEEISEIEEAVNTSIAMHELAICEACPGISERVLMARITALAMEKGMCAFQPIVTVHGEILHNHAYSEILECGQLLLVDAGAETKNGYAGDLTTTIPVNGKYTQKQRDIYEIVLEAGRIAGKNLAPGVSYKELHLLASKVIA